MVQWSQSAQVADETMRGVAPNVREAMTLHRVTVAAFTALLVISGFGSLMARQGPPTSVPPVELTHDSAETPPAVGGGVEEVAEPDLSDAVSDADAAIPDPAPEQILIPDDPAAQEAPAVDDTLDAPTPGDDHEDDDDEGEDD